jgi:hypothetical protein
MPNDNVLGAGAATAVWAVWTAIELGFRRHRAIPSRDRDQGSLLALLVAHGLGLAFANWWTLACSLLPYLVAIGYRIHVEEAVLRETFGPAYAQYARTTKRIVPWVY